MAFPSREAERRGNFTRAQINKEEFRWDGSDNGRRAMAAGSTVSSNLGRSYAVLHTFSVIFITLCFIYIVFIILYFVSIIFIILYFISIIFIILYFISIIFIIFIIIFCFYYFYILLFFYYLVNSWSIKIELKEKKFIAEMMYKEGFL